MTGALFHLSERIELHREDYRAVNAALETALDALDRSGAEGAANAARRVIEHALRLLARRIWPDLNDLDTEA